MPSQEYDVTKDAEHLIDGGRLVDSLDDRCQKVELETRTSRPSYSVILPLQHTVKRLRCSRQHMPC